MSLPHRVLEEKSICWRSYMKLSLMIVESIFQPIILPTNLTWAKWETLMLAEPSSRSSDARRGSLLSRNQFLWRTTSFDQPFSLLVHTNSLLHYCSRRAGRPWSRQCFATVYGSSSQNLIITTYGHLKEASKGYHCQLSFFGRRGWNKALAIFWASNAQQRY